MSVSIMHHPHPCRNYSIFDVFRFFLFARGYFVTLLRVAYFADIVAPYAGCGAPALAELPSFS